MIIDYSTLRPAMTTGNVIIQWLPPGPPTVSFDVTVTAAEPSPHARICYGATDPAVRYIP